MHSLDALKRGQIVSKEIDKIDQGKGIGYVKRQSRADHLLDDTISPWHRASSFALTAPRVAIERFLTRHKLFEMIIDLPGSIVEIGVQNGQGLMSFAHFSSILEPNNVQRRLYGFDTFEGVGGKMVGARRYLDQSVDLFDADRPLGQVQKVHIVPGPAEETIPEFLDQNPHLLLSLLYLDSTSSAPTRQALDLLYPRLVPNGLLVFDQLNFPNHPEESEAWLRHPLSQSVSLQRFIHDSQVCFAQKSAP